MIFLNATDWSSTPCHTGTVAAPPSLPHLQGFNTTYDGMRVAVQHSVAVVAPEIGQHAEREWMDEWNYYTVIVAGSEHKLLRCQHRLSSSSCNPHLEMLSIRHCQRTDDHLKYGNPWLLAINTISPHHPAVSLAQYVAQCMNWRKYESAAAIHTRCLKLLAGVLHMALEDVIHNIRLLDENLVKLYERRRRLIVDETPDLIDSVN